MTSPSPLLPVHLTVRNYVLCMDLTKRMSSWAESQGDVFDAKRFGPTCMTMALAAPWAPAADLELVARQAALLWAVDDHLEQVPSAEEFSADLAPVIAAVEGRAAAGGVAVGLAELRTGLSRFPLFAELGALWAGSISQGFTAMVNEWRVAHDMTDGAPLPTPEEYLRNAAASILMKPMVLAMLIVTERDSLLPHWDRIGKALHEADIAVRLANDLASYDRERRGQDLNIRMLGVTTEQLRQDVVDALQRFGDHLEPLFPLRAAVTVDRHVRTAVEFYLWTDYTTA